MKRPDWLYHGSVRRIAGPLTPTRVQDSEDHVHTHAAVFATARADLAALFMFPYEILASIGFEQDVAYICVWGKRTDVNTTGYLYVLPPDTFEKIGKSYEWQSFSPVTPVKVLEYTNVVQGMMHHGVQVYFIEDEGIFDQIVENKKNRAHILVTLTSENQKDKTNIRAFSTNTETLQD